eukprot:GHVS01072127.1.p1 GENE.GHVS01072127.1~~GHVS01072127.1.p1  ORF type:complete len:652 (-),score=76.44 GHVS01072127.1:2296-4080(-)
MSLSFQPQLLSSLVPHVSPRAPTVGIYHPAADGGGGGERVLWSLVRSLLTYGWTVVIYTRPRERGSSPGSCYSLLSANAPLLRKVYSQFSIELAPLLAPPEASRPVTGTGISDLTKARSANNHTGAGVVLLVEVESAIWPMYPFPCFTLLCQAAASVLTALHCLYRWCPSVWIDTTGAPFTAPVVRLCARTWKKANRRVTGQNTNSHRESTRADATEGGQWELEPMDGGEVVVEGNDKTKGGPSSVTTDSYECLVRVCWYVHYPCISADMVRNVSGRMSAVNNPYFVARSAVLTNAKLLYYRLFLSLYRLSGRCADEVACNSTWTKKHLADVLGESKRLHTVYPPFDMSTLQQKGEHQQRELCIASIGQFRPEKNHQLQLTIFSQVYSRLVNKGLRPRLIIVGSTRNQQDRELLASLQEQTRGQDGAKEKDWWGDSVEFRVGVEYSELSAVLHSSRVLLHTMVEEHFGIAVIEALASGVVVVAHNSGGIKEDILKPLKTGKRKTEIATETGVRKAGTSQEVVAEGSDEGACMDVGLPCDSEDEFVVAACRGLEGYYEDEQIVAMRRAAQQAVTERFYGDEIFGRTCLKRFHLLS